MCIQQNKKTEFIGLLASNKLILELIQQKQSSKASSSNIRSNYLCHTTLFDFTILESFWPVSFLPYQWTNPILNLSQWRGKRVQQKTQKQPRNNFWSCPPQNVLLTLLRRTKTVNTSIRVICLTKIRRLSRWWWRTNSWSSPHFKTRHD